MRTNYDAMALVHRLFPATGMHLYKATMSMNDVTEELEVNLNGNPIKCLWSDSIHVWEGDHVLVAVMQYTRGQAEGVVIARLADRPRPAWGVVTVVPGGGAPITVAGPDITDYLCFYVMSYTPAVNDIVALVWAGGRGIVMGELTSELTADPATSSSLSEPMEPLDEEPEDGEDAYVSSNSGTWQISEAAWDVYRFGGGHAYQSNDLVGAWFYNDGPSQHAGKSIDAVTFTLGSRLAVGVYTDPIVVHFWLHTSTHKPAGALTLTLGPIDVTIPAGTAQTEVQLPVEWGQAIVDDGGGIAITGDNLAGFKSRIDQPTSGLLELEWSVI